MLDRVSLRRFLSLLTVIATTSIACLSPTVGHTEDVDAEETLEFAERLQTLFGTLAAKVRPAVVSIVSTEIVQLSNEGDNIFDKLFRGKNREIHQPSLGSGVIIDPRGYILTNSHVARSDDKLLVKLWDKREATARLIKREETTDIALIKIDLDNLTTLAMGDSDSLRVGHWVMAIGNPFGFSQTVSTGIVSAVGRSDVGILGFESFIQTDASINQGNSGGPLVNLRGDIIGINTAIYSSDSGGSLGIGFAIPINLAKALVARWIDGKNASYLGILPRKIDEDMVAYFKLDSSEGVFVKVVHPDTPAQVAGIQARDIILRFDNERIRDAHHLKVVVARKNEGETVPVEVLRRDKKLQLEVTLVQNPNALPVPGDGPSAKLASTDGSKPDKPKTTLGLTVVGLDKSVRERFDVAENVKGIAIWDVDAGSPAGDKGLQAGDIITEINYRSISNKKEFLETFNKAEKAIMIKVVRGQEDLGYVFFKR